MTIIIVQVSVAYEQNNLPRQLSVMFTHHWFLVINNNNKSILCYLIMQFIVVPVVYSSIIGKKN